MLRPKAKSNRPFGRSQRGRVDFELLEDRVLLDAGGVSAFMTLSFAPDGTPVGDRASSLVSTFAPVASPQQWKVAIEQAFNQWAVQTNADIGVVPDSGDALGVPGRREADDRFGDIRVTAAPLGENVMALSFPRDNVALGTWAGDVIFNSDADWQSLDQITAVALHEAGHVFGLEHSDHPASAMHGHGNSNVTTLSQGDKENVRFLFGDRAVDRNELDESNDDLLRATPLTANLADDLLALSYGDVSTPGDEDVFRVNTPDDIEEEISIRVQTAGLSLLSPTVSVFNSDGELLEQETAEDGVVEVEFESEDNEAFYVSISAADDSPSQVGRYAIAITLDAEDFDDDDFDDFADGDLFSFDESEYSRFVRDDDDEFQFDDDQNMDDDLLTARLLEPVSFNAGRVWFTTTGSIAGPDDPDVYVLESPDDNESVGSVLTVTVRSLKSGGLVPAVELRNADGELLESSVIMNGNGETVLQLPETQPDEKYFVTVKAATQATAFSRGRYELSMDFGSQVVELRTFSEGALNASTPVLAQPLFVATPQLFHFLLSAEAQEGSVQPVTVDIYDETGSSVFSLVAYPWQVRSAANPLLQPGRYTVRIGVSESEGEVPAINYSLTGISVSNPFGVLPVDPTGQPKFACDGVDDQFCYPGGTTSDVPLFWDNFIEDYIDQKVKEQGQGGPVAPNGDWWDWYWELLDQVPVDSAPPETQADSYRVPGGYLLVAKDRGVLSNDVSQTDASLLAAVLVEPKHGLLNLNSNGAFRYTPNPGFYGVDSFVYDAFDFVTSRTATVTLQVSPGDINGDGNVGFDDFLTLSANFGQQAASPENGDSDGDGVIGFADFLIVSANFGRTLAP